MSRLRKSLVEMAVRADDVWDPEVRCAIALRVTLAGAVHLGVGAVRGKAGLRLSARLGQLLAAIGSRVAWRRGRAGHDACEQPDASEQAP